jgi:3-oxoacyl-[acyl-carrier protein] reductase
MDLGLRGRRALVMGASKGLGRAIAEGLAAEGTALAISARDPTTLAPVAAACRAASGADCVAVAADVADHASLDAMCDRAVAELGGVDIVVLNHGGPPPGPALALTQDALQAWFGRMVLAPIRVAMRLLPAMRERRWGRIITVGSSGMVQPIPDLVLSNALRGAIVGWNRTLANEVAAEGITCNIVAPGSIETDRIRENAGHAAARKGVALADELAARAAAIPARRIGRPEEFAAMAVFLASERASYVTGRVHLVDGGATRGV